MTKYRQGDALILARPNDLSLKGEEIEILKIKSRVSKIYEIRVLSTGKTYSAGENQLDELDDALTIVDWKDCAWRPE